MSERRFVIHITESELKRRIDCAFRDAFCTLTETMDYDKAIDIFLHGEGEKGEDPYRRVFGIDGPYEIDSQPAPTPTRKEWEEWGEKMPSYGDCDSGIEWEEKLQQWFLTMPIVPKEGEK